MQRDKIFNQIRKGVCFEYSNLWLEWLKPLCDYEHCATDVTYNNETIYLYFEGKIFGENVVRLFTTGKADTLLTELSCSVSSIDKIKSIFNHLETELGKPNMGSVHDALIFVTWEDTDSIIEISTNDHHGGMWWTLSIRHKVGNKNEYIGKQKETKQF